MQLLRKLSIRSRLIMSSVIVSVLLVVLGVVTWVGINSITRGYDYVVNHEDESALLATDIEGHVAKMRQYEKDMIINSGDKNTVLKYFEEWSDAYKETKDLTDALNKLADGQEATANHKEMTESLEKYKLAIARLKDDLTEAGSSAEKANAQFATNKDNIRALGKKAGDMADAAAKKSDEEEAKVTVAASRTLFSVAAVAILIMIAAIVVTLLINQSIMGPLLDITERVQDVARGNGDLTKRVAADSTDELGQLGASLNQFMQVIHEIVKDVIVTLKETVKVAENLAEASQNLSSGTEEMSQQTQSIATASSQLHQNLEVVSSSIEEMSISVSEIARRSVEAAGVAGEANNRTSTTNDIVVKLGQNAREIGKVIESIVDIADQTNLLALNAAIEAADAGDTGKRFAVVASEVKELARQTSDSSEEIKNRIESIQRSSEDTIKAIESITNVIQKVNDVNSAIASFVEEQSITAREISSNATQAATVSTDVAKNVAGVSTVVRSGAQEATRISGLASQLNTMAQHLSSALGRFKV
ncbi:MAG: methyl-accepting chemotaxis protein [Leptospirales bacterium]|nr:methyl-accepting chemotaxis protein [Leptospirales bacterium]